MAKTSAGTPYQPQCRALTADGKQCRNSSRGTSKYCASHKGYQPPATKGLAQRIEGKSWSATDKRTDRQSAREADLAPRVGGAKDTPLATRRRTAAKAGKTSARPAAKSVAAPARRAPAAPRTAPPVRDLQGEGPGYVAGILQEERDYLVVFEEPDPDGLPVEDGLVLDIDAGNPVSLGEVSLEQKLDLELNNNTTWVGKLGFIVAVLGSLFGVATCVWFMVIYPSQWYLPDGSVSGSWKIPATALLAVGAFLMMLAGVVMTHYGRRIQARGNLSRMRIVEKAFQPRVALGDER